ncbi:MAG: chorismate mutase [Eubacteriales bacterium]|jgi:monofunctional chorismate mutase
MSENKDSLNLAEIREKINAADDELKRAFLIRMELVKQVAEYKKARGTAIIDAGREREIIDRMTCGEDERTKKYLTDFFTALFAISKEFQKEELQ